jgi:3-phosphoshikimate 1-carboxyvinyltransferase
MGGEQQDESWATPAATGPVAARLTVPGSKSITNRALILAALASGPTRITGPLRARDTGLMAAAITALGATVDAVPLDAVPLDTVPLDAVALDAVARDAVPLDAGTPGAPAPYDLLVTPGWADGPATVDVGNAGTVIRFVPPAAALARADVAFRGDPRASQRPVGPLLAALAQLGADISDDGRRAVPFTVHGRGQVPGGTVTLDASGSSQLVSGLLLAAPRYAKGAEIRHEGPRIPSAPHIAMTVAMLRAAGADVDAGGLGRDGPVSDVWRVHPGELAPGVIAVEPDLSSAAPFLAAAMVTGGAVTIAGWPAASLQAAGLILDTLTAMGASVALSPDGLRVSGPGSITGITADLSEIGELTPVLVALAALADGPSVFTGVAHIRTHETDRLAALAGEIGALGGRVTELPDGLRIEPRPLAAGGTVFDSHDDHRLVMAAAVLGLVVPGVRAGNVATVGKTFPGFTALWQQMLEPSP